MDPVTQVLIELHLGEQRQGPGDAVFSRQILAALPPLPAEPRIVDLGCGCGAGALLLAQHFGVSVTGVDLAQPFLDQMRRRARDRGIAHRIHALVCDFADPPIKPGSVDLLWSEGAAYNLTFAGALEAWRPLLAPQGLAVISEMTWFTDDVPDAPRRYWQQAYPAMADQTANAARARAAGFEVVATRNLPTQAWWDNYYNPLLKRMASITDPDATMQAVIDEMHTEIDLFDKHSEHFGYTFYLLAAN